MALLDKYPFDAKQVKKGDLLTNQIIETITGVKPSDDDFRLAALRVAKEVEKRTGFTAKVTDEGVRVLTDSEASLHNYKWLGHSVRAIPRRFALLSNVDVTNLTLEERPIHDVKLIHAGLYVQHVGHAGKAIRQLKAPKEPRAAVDPPARMTFEEKKDP